MLAFETFVARHGEVVTQAILEKLERYEGIHHGAALPLEQRWDVLMREDSQSQHLTA